MDFKPLITLLAIVNPLAIVPFFIHFPLHSHFRINIQEYYQVRLGYTKHFCEGNCFFHCHNI